VHISSLDDDYYVFDEDQVPFAAQRRRHTFRVGDRLRVQLAELNPDLREINFRYLGRRRGPPRRER
jgi:ribonuclease R